MTALALAGGAAYGAALYQWRRAQAALEQNLPVQAGARVRLCLLVWPRSLPVHRLAARAAWMRGDLEGAETLLNRCLQLNHGASAAIQLEFYLMRAIAGEVHDVEPDLTNYLLDNDPESPFILETLARAHVHNLEYGAAWKCLTAWIDLKPDAARAYHYRGWVNEHLIGPTEALEDYQRALELDPDLAAARLRLAEILLEQTKPAEARLHLERLHKEFPDRADLQARLGHCLLLEGKNDDARPVLEAAVQRLPDDAALLHNLAKLELQAEPPQPVKAEAWLRHALAVDSFDTEALFILKSALEMQQRKPEAKRVLEEYEKKSATIQRTSAILREEGRNPSNDPRVEAEVGGLLLAQGHEREGLHWLDQALHHDPDDRAAHEALADYYDKKGDRDKAAAHRRKIRSQGSGVRGQE